MRLIKPEPYRFDPGRVLPPEEAAQVAPEITPITEIKPKACKRETNNDRYRLGRK